MMPPPPPHKHTYTQWHRIARQQVVKDVSLVHPPPFPHWKHPQVVAFGTNQAPGEASPPFPHHGPHPYPDRNTGAREHRNARTRRKNLGSQARGMWRHSGMFTHLWNCVHKDWMIFEKKKLDNFMLFPNVCFRSPLTKFPYLILLFKLASGPQKNLTVTKKIFRKTNMFQPAPRGSVFFIFFLII